MKKFLKFKEDDGLVKISKNKYFSKNQIKTINSLLENEFYDLTALSEKLNVVQSKNNSIKVKYLRYKDLMNKLNKEVYFSKDNIDKHFIGLGATGTGKTKGIRDIYRLCIDEMKEKTHFKSSSEEGNRKLMDSLIEMAENEIFLSEYGSGHLAVGRAIPPKEIVIFEDGK